MNIKRKTIGSIVGSLVVIVILLFGRQITSTVEAHHWVGVILLMCALAFISWGMFWRKEDKA